MDKPMIDEAVEDAETAVDCVWVLYYDQPPHENSTETVRMYWWSDGDESDWRPSLLGAKRYMTRTNAWSERDDLAEETTGNIKFLRLRAKPKTVEQLVNPVENAPS